MIYKSTQIVQRRDWGTERIIQFVAPDDGVQRFVELVYQGKLQGPPDSSYFNPDEEYFYEAEGYHLTDSIVYDLDSKTITVAFPDGRYFQMKLLYRGGFEIQEVERYEITTVEEKFRPISA